jgi:hypothetical protein
MRKDRDEVVDCWHRKLRDKIGEAIIRDSLEGKVILLGWVEPGMLSCCKE